MTRDRKIFFLYNLHRYEIEYYALLEGPANTNLEALEEEFSTRYGLNWSGELSLDPGQANLALDRLVTEAIAQGWIPDDGPVRSEERIFLEWLKAEKDFTVPDPARAEIKEFRQRR